MEVGGDAMSVVSQNRMVVRPHLAEPFFWGDVGGAGGGEANTAGADAAAQTPLPIRLSYHNGNHYNSIDDLDHSNYLDALGVPGQHGGVEKTNVDTALARSEQELIEKEMMASSLADSQAQDAAAEEARLVELALKDSVEEAMGATLCTPARARHQRLFL